jgi:hypothetical protein
VKIVGKILADIENVQSGAPSKYPNYGDVIASGGNIMEVMTPKGKPLGDCTAKDLSEIAEARKRVALICLDPVA